MQARTTADIQDLALDLTRDCTAAQYCINNGKVLDRNRLSMIGEQEQSPGLPDSERRDSLRSRRNPAALHPQGRTFRFQALRVANGRAQFRYQYIRRRQRGREPA